MSHPLPQADFLPASTPVPVLTYAPMVLKVAGRPVDLEIRVSFPATGDSLPVILLSHGHGQLNYVSSMRGYNPLVDFYAGQGFVVLQPTHLNSKTLGLDPAGPEGPLFWRSRATDFHTILDRLDEIEAAVPGLAGRLDRSRIAAVGHSAGGHTVGMLLGMQVIDPLAGDELVKAADPRVKAGVLIAAAGRGEDLSEFAYEHFPFARHTDFTTMTAPALVIVGDDDANPMFSPRPDWRADAYTLSPAPKSLLTFLGGKHSFGGISGYDVKETTDEDTVRVSALQRLTTAYLHSTLNADPLIWQEAQQALDKADTPIAHVESK